MTGFRDMHMPGTAAPRVPRRERRIALLAAAATCGELAADTRPDRHGNRS
jgi:hypothetical protein